MHTLYPRIFDLFKRSLDAHIRSKTEEFPFHQFSQSVYEKLFECAHLIGERSEDIGEPINEMSECEYIQDLYDALEEAKDFIHDQVDEGNSIGTDNLLRSLYDDLEWLCGTARGFIKEEQEEYNPIVNVDQGQKPALRVYKG